MRADGGTRDIASAAADDRGSVLILGVGLTAVVLALLMVVRVRPEPANSLSVQAVSIILMY